MIGVNQRGMLQRLAATQCHSVVYKLDNTTLWMIKSLERRGFVTRFGYGRVRITEAGREAVATGGYK